MTNMIMDNETPSLEDQFASIEEIIGKMEAGEATLDETFDLYKKGLEKIKAANAMLDDMEKAMLDYEEESDTDTQTDTEPEPEEAPKTGQRKKLSAESRKHSKS